MPARIEVAGLQVDTILYDFIVGEVLPGTGLDPDAFWRGTADLFDELSPRNRSLLAKRDDLQSRIDDFHAAQPGQPEPGVEELTAWCRTSLAGFKRPRHFVFGELPKTATGKVQKSVLRERAAALGN